MIITIEPVNLEPVLSALSRIPGGIERAARSAIRRTLKGGRKDAGTLTRRRYTLPAGVVTRSLSIKVSGMSGEMRSRGGRNPLEKAKTNPKGRIRTRGRYIRAEVVRGQGGILPKAFRPHGAAIYERVGRTRYPIQRLTTVSAPGMVSHPSISEPIANKMSQRFSVNFLHEAAAVLGGF